MAQIHLHSTGFHEYHKIAESIQRKEITARDLIKCTRNDLVDLCKEYNITTIQKNRFIEAIENLHDGDAKEVKPLSQNFGKASKEQEKINMLNDLTRRITDTMKDIKKCKQQECVSN